MLNSIKLTGSWHFFSSYSSNMKSRCQTEQRIKWLSKLCFFSFFESGKTFTIINQIKDQDHAIKKRRKPTSSHYYYVSLGLSSKENWIMKPWLLNRPHNERSCKCHAED